MFEKDSHLCKGCFLPVASLFGKVSNKTVIFWWPPYSNCWSSSKF